eukprot:TRINITY_DN47599_c0_g1_i1.p1 TRINITY_DN47599_c0_g1~~TRINITY_DN47599_c0_g1_i1.p1  ORF type:complete len:767 (+),score=199.45 TRINITY_DN47599_c0_g1_i1:52-2301(+)
MASDQLQTPRSGTPSDGGGEEDEEEPLLVHDYTIASDFERLVKAVEGQLRDWASSGGFDGERTAVAKDAGCTVVVQSLKPAADDLSEWLQPVRKDQPQRDLLNRAFGAAPSLAITCHVDSDAVLSGSELLSVLLLAADGAGRGSLRCVADDVKDGRVGRGFWVGYEPDDGCRLQLEILQSQTALRSPQQLCDLLFLHRPDLSVGGLDALSIAAASEFTVSGQQQATWTEYMRSLGPAKRGRCVWTCGTPTDPVAEVKVRMWWPPAPAPAFSGLDLTTGPLGLPELPPRAAARVTRKYVDADEWGAATENLRGFFDVLLMEQQDSPVGVLTGLHDVVADRVLLVREGEDFASKALGVLPRGAVVEVAETRGRRARISRPVQGWASSWHTDGSMLLRERAPMPLPLSHSRLPWHVSFPRPQDLPPTSEPAYDRGPVACAVCGRCDRLGEDVAPGWGQSNYRFRCHECAAAPAGDGAAPALDHFDAACLAEEVCSGVRSRGDSGMEELLRRVAAAAVHCKTKDDFPVLWNHILHIASLPVHAKQLSPERETSECPVGACVAALIRDSIQRPGDTRAAVSRARDRLSDGEVLVALAPYAYRHFRDAVLRVAPQVPKEAAEALDATAAALLRRGRSDITLRDRLRVLAEECAALEWRTMLSVSLRCFATAGLPDGVDLTPEDHKSVDALAAAVHRDGDSLSPAGDLTPATAIYATSLIGPDTVEYVVRSEDTSARRVRIYAQIRTEDTLLATVT